MWWSILAVSILNVCVMFKSLSIPLVIVSCWLVWDM